MARNEILIPAVAFHYTRVYMYMCVYSHELACPPHNCVGVLGTWAWVSSPSMLSEPCIGDCINKIIIAFLVCIVTAQ